MALSPSNAPIMLKLCSLNVTLIAKTNHLDCFKYAWVVCQVIVISLQNGVYQPYMPEAEPRACMADTHKWVPAYKPKFDKHIHCTPTVEELGFPFTKRIMSYLYTLSH